MNFSNWWEQVHFYLGVLDFDLALPVEKPVVIINESSDDEKTFHKTSERSNKLSLMFMWMTIANNLKMTIYKTNNAKWFMKIVKEYCWQKKNIKDNFV